ncbi:MAG: M20/M25/M40 family metallo-hydrolase [Achromobacter kerstersii]|uniref:M20/M25/M40 family metallo-hydrolase n=1 Tax=Achromobacter kerstersii TaxID=1353890 RepID=UPI003CFE4F4F
MSDPFDPVLTHLAARQPQIEAWLKTFLRIPSVSADPAYAGSMEDARRFLCERLRAEGLQQVQLLDGGGEAAVYGEWMGAPGRPTLLIYGHYDVQPADPVELWRTPPFEPTQDGDRIYGRGTSDVKGSTTVALEVVFAYLATLRACPVNIKVFIEGEEETGSPTLRPLIDRYRGLLTADAVLSADGGRASAQTPTINTGARGHAALEIKLRTAAKDLHSGRYGGGVRNALHEMATLLASLHADDGSVAVAGFHDGAEPPTPRQRQDTAAFPYDEAAFFTDVDGASHGEPGYRPRERITLRPALDVNGMWGGYTGAGTKTIIPCEAQAKLTVRIVEGQDPAHVIQSVLTHLQRHCPAGVGLDVVAMNAGSPAATLAACHPLVTAAEAVLQSPGGPKPIHVRLGASVPITSVFKEMLGIDTLMFGFNLPDEDVHAPNEFFRLSSIRDGVQAWTKLLDALGRFEPAAFHRS